LVAAGYGLWTLWNGRPLYYTYSEGYVEMVQAQDLDPQQVALGQKLNPSLAPHWYSLPRWIYAPLPKDPKLATEIASAAVGGGDDVIDLPRYYQPWAEGSADLRQRLQPLDKVKEFDKKDREVAVARLRQLGLAPDRPQMLAMTGKGKPLVAVIDPATTRIAALIRVD
jgi:hypothetical protein